MARLKDGISSELIDIFQLKRSHHVVTLDREQKIVFEKIVEFFRHIG